MKFWTKTYFYVLILFLLVFNLSICWIMHTTLKCMLNSEKEKSLGQHYFIKQSIESDMESLKSNNKLSDDSLKNLMKYYSNYYGNQNLSFSLRDEKKSIFSNLQYGQVLNDKLLDIKGGQNVEILEQNGERYVLIIGNIDKFKNKYSLISCYKIERVMKVWSKLEKTFICFSFIVSIVLAILLGILLNSRSKPLKQLMILVNKITSGNYGVKVQVRGKDEFAMLGISFNEMSEKIRDTVDHLNSDMSMKQQFIDNVSHELRTPLTSIYGYAEYIQRAAISEEDKYECTNYIMKESKRLQYMSNRLLDMTVRRKSEVVLGEINIDELFERVLKTISSSARAKSISINVSNKLEFISGEIELIESLLVNLLDNSIKASEENKSINITTFSLNNEKIIEIVDEGKGISEEHLRHITEPFYRADKARSRAEGGVGLGLALCKQIMDMHGGKLEITSKLNEGTTAKLIFTSSK